LKKKYILHQKDKVKLYNLFSNKINNKIKILKIKIIIMLISNKRNRNNQYSNTIIYQLYKLDRVNL